MTTQNGEQRWLVTGGAGFIGSAFVLRALEKKLAGKAAFKLLNLDKLTYSGNPENLASVAANPAYSFARGDIGDTVLVEKLLQEFAPTAIINFAAESHVDRSIKDPDAFVQSNVTGVCSLLRKSTDYWRELPADERKAFRFLHVSTDEVFGSLKPSDPPFTETTPYAPNSPYSASKAASDHFVRAFHETYGLPTLITNCSNNYGPRQFPEKLIPLMILHALAGKPLPIYGTGENIRDWLHVDDHCAAIQMVAERGKPGETYAIGGRTELNNIDIVRRICRLLDALRPKAGGRYEDQITFVNDRPGHDMRYAIDCSKIERELGWKAAYTFEAGLEETVRWYLANTEWVENVQSGEYRNWLENNYAGR